MADPASSPAAVGHDSSAATSVAAAATVTPADDTDESMLLEILELQDKVQDLVIVMRKAKIDYTYVAPRMSIICKLQIQHQVQALQKLIACMRRDSKEYATLDANISRVGEWVQGNGSRAPEPQPDSQPERTLDANMSRGFKGTNQGRQSRGQTRSRSAAA